MSVFSGFSQRINGILGNLRRRGTLSEADVDAVLRDIRVALLEADVALPVVKDFIASLKEKAVGAEIIRSINPAQMVVKLVHDHLVDLLGSERVELNLAASPPVVILMAGLQGSGKTTTSGKLALRLKNTQYKKILLASLDVYRPAAQEQLATVAVQAGVASLPIIPGQKPLDITKRALESARLEGYDALILDTAGRLHIDDELMEELRQVKALANPLETLLVVDSLTGQDAVNIGKTFQEKIGITGIILTRVDGDARGGAALSMRAVTGQPIKFIGMGEKLDALEPFDPARIASRILDMGDVVSLVEKASAAISEEDNKRMTERFQKGQFDLEDYAAQLKQMKKMGGLGSLMSMLPGIGVLKDKLENANIDEKILSRQEAIISSMTPQERRFPKLLNASRKIRVANGAGVQVQDINRLLKQFQQMEALMKKVKKLGKKGLLRGGLQGLFSS